MLTQHTNELNILEFIFAEMVILVVSCELLGKSLEERTRRYPRGLRTSVDTENGTEESHLRVMRFVWENLDTRRVSTHLVIGKSPR